MLATVHAAPGPTLVVILPRPRAGSTRRPADALTRLLGSPGTGQSIMGAMIVAKLFRARFRRLFTVPRLHPVISAISS